MRKILMALALSALGTGVAGASDETDIRAVLHQMQVGFNKGGDMKGWLAACADETSIIDSIPPYEWHGAGGCSKWLSDYNAYIHANEITDAVVTIGKPRHTEVTGDHAYVVAPATFVYKVKGAPSPEFRSTLTGALQKGPSGWRVTGWSWSEGTQVPAKTASGK